MLYCKSRYRRDGIFLTELSFLIIIDLFWGSTIKQFLPDCGKAQKRFMRLTYKLYLYVCMNVCRCYVGS